MKQLTLVTRHIQNEAETDACLLVVDDQPVNASALSEKVRNLIDHKPLTRNIYVIAPILGGEQLQQMLVEGLAVLRAKADDSNDGPQFWMLDLRAVEAGLALQVLPLSVGPEATVAVGSWQSIEPSLIEGWLFDLFSSSDALVQAPYGVHFAKSSGKHSNRTYALTAV